jgi:hypothetical protein
MKTNWYKLSSPEIKTQKGLRHISILFSEIYTILNFPVGVGLFASNDLMAQNDIHYVRIPNDIGNYLPEALDILLKSIGAVVSDKPNLSVFHFLDGDKDFDFANQD